MLHLRRAHEKFLDVQLIQKQCSPHPVNSQTDVGLTVGNFQKLLDVLSVNENTINNIITLYIIMLYVIQTSESETTSTSSPTQSMKSYAIPKLRREKKWITEVLLSNNIYFPYQWCCVTSIVLYLVYCLF